MATDELAYVLLNPYTLLKSRTGGVIARLLARTGLELVATRMFSPSRELAESYAEMIKDALRDAHPRTGDLMYEYILHWYCPDPDTGRKHRVMILLFRGEDAVRKVEEVTGRVATDTVGGETIRETYGDFIQDRDGTTRYFEPAVFIAPRPQDVAPNLKLWARYSPVDGGILSRVEEYPPGASIEQTLVLIKPDNFRFPSGRPGNIIDMFSRTGLYIIGAKVHAMSVAQAMEFYGPVKDILSRKFRGMAVERGRRALERELEIEIEDSLLEPLAPVLAEKIADVQFRSIVKFMTGYDPAEADPSTPGREHCLALIYEGENAVEKIRGVLGSTDPSKAEPGTVRREMGTNIMVNAAHASDSPENAEREMRIVNVGEDAFGRYVADFYGGLDE